MKSLFGDEIKTMTTTTAPKIRLADRPIICPFTLAIDHRERAGGYTFDGIRADAKQKNRPLEIHAEIVTLKTGDYTIVGMENLVCVERKSFSDLYSTLSDRRELFEEEHRRMADMTFACVMIEADWEMILYSPPDGRQLLPKTVLRTAISWQIRYGIPWFTMGSKRLAEVTTFRILEKFWKEHQQKTKGPSHNGNTHP